MNWLSLKEMPTGRMKLVAKLGDSAIAIEARMKKPANRRFAGQNS